MAFTFLRPPPMLYVSTYDWAIKQPNRRKEGEIQTNEKKKVERTKTVKSKEQKPNNFEQILFRDKIWYFFLC